MYLGIDIGGSKTLMAALDGDGVIQEIHKFPTNPVYEQFLEEIAGRVPEMTTSDFLAGGVGIPGKLDRSAGRLIACGNLPWRDKSIQADLEVRAGCPLVIENDAKLAALSEAMLLKEQFNKVLYLTISTGIGAGLVTDQQIDHTLADMEAGQMLFSHGGQLKSWESFVSGKAIVRRFHQQAREITDPNTWSAISRDLAIGLIELIAIVQPEVIVFGGSVGRYFDRFVEPLSTALKAYENPLLSIPSLRPAGRPERAVIYGCYDQVKAVYGRLYSQTR